MDVITISRQLGSLGFQVARQAAERFNFRLVWRDLINQAAIQAGAPEVALAMLDEFNLLGISPTQQQFMDYFLVVGQVIHRIADEGNIIILGRAGQVLLRENPRVLHVRVIAPHEVRVKRLILARGITPEAADAQILTSDRARKNYLRRFYKVDWEDPTLYDLTINTGQLSVETAVEILYRASQSSKFSANDLQPDQEEFN